jgi:chromosome segregation ATPase
MDSFALGLSTRAPLAEHNFPTKRQWYSEYSAAMLESNRANALDRIESARQAIQNRAAELRFAVPENNREREDLQSALGHLSNLLQTMSGEAKGIVWD